MPAVPTIFELIDSGDAQGVRDALSSDPGAAAQHDENGLTVLMRAAYRGGDVFEAVRAANPPLEAFDRIMVGETGGLPAPDAWGRAHSPVRTTSPGYCWSTTPIRSRKSGD